ncbi:MAG: extracellular solute-binding protein [Ruminococcaceae bacterium]|nr:extracellular solute-binding protein [Oscillospiraceae bacterium]
MKRFKSLLALLLALVMLMTTFTACGTQTDENDATPTPAVEPTVAEGPDYTEGGKYMDFVGATGGMEYRLPKFDFPTQEVVFMVNAEMVRTDFDTLDPFYDVYELMPKSTLASAWDCITKFIALYMADDSPDVCMFNYEASLVNKGYLANWLDYVDTELDLWEDIRTSIQESLFKGGLYGMSIRASREGYCIFYNKAIFEELGVKTPDEHLADGTWTWDQLRETAIATTVDSDSDGNAEIYGFAISNPELFAFTTGEEFVIIEGDNVINNMRSEAVARGIQAYVDLVDMDCVYPSSTGSEVIFQQNALAMCQAATWCAKYFVEQMKRGEVSFVPIPRDPSADKYYISEDFGGMSLPSNAKNPYGAAAYVTSAKYMQIAKDKDPEYRAELEAMSLEEQIEELGWTLELADKAKELYDNEKYYPVHVWANIFRISSLLGGMYYRPRTGEPWGTIVEEVYPEYQKIIEEAMEADY